MNTTSTRPAWAGPDSPWVIALRGALAFAEMISALRDLLLMAAALCWRVGYLNSVTH
jgi:hypothetical protein